MFDRAGVTLSLGLLLFFVALAAYTDLRWRMIFNATTYPGMVIALAINAVGSLIEYQGWASRQVQQAVGWIGLWQSVLGWLACGGILVVCFVFFQLRGGDVKLMAMIGAFLGLREGIEVLLWTFVNAAAIAVILLIWRFGAWQLVRQSWSRVSSAVRLRDMSQLASPPGSPLKTMLDLAPSALVALILVRFDLLGPLRIL
ncbi:MAG: A24 family peptidase [Planctomycetota bacterium]|nr:A24 family peptidase [Planctomycetota bacterium]